ncbi:hypothetical protein ASD42_32025 [Nocardia sp. Root136]|nr:hypothetical protein ASD42_32025 [Nocardia sp. Root136]
MAGPADPATASIPSASRFEEDPMTVLPSGSEADRVEQETFVSDSDRESGPDVAAVHAQEPGRRADPTDCIDQAWSVPDADDDLSCLAC